MCFPSENVDVSVTRQVVADVDDRLSLLWMYSGGSEPVEALPQSDAMLSVIRRVR